MNIIKKYFPILLVIIICIILGGVVGGIIFATDNIPTLVIGSKDTNVNPLFTEDLEKWYPGHYITKTLKVKNNQNSYMLIKNISMEIELNKDNSNLDLEGPIGREYLDNMELKIELEDKKFFNKNHNQVLYNGNFKDFLLGVEPNLKIGRKKDLNLIYTIGMNRNASANIEGVDGSIDFIFQVQQDLHSELGHEPDKDSGLIWLADQKIPKGRDIEGHWAHDCIAILIEKGIIKGYPDGSIRPENNITRGEAATLVGRSLGLQKSNNRKSIYEDKLPEWAENHILALTDLGVLEGYEDKEFKANNYMTREEMVKLLVLAFEKEMVNISELKFLDKNEIGTWAVNYVRIGVDNKIVEGYPDNTFRPKAKITRGETFTIICKLLNLHENHINK